MTSVITVGESMVLLDAPASGRLGAATSTIDSPTVTTAVITRSPAAA